ncbi:hypothetical protein ACFZBU_45115 [Embleya sp. NPDC008237]|uniref:hypothetical protein n=1 Tax=Embleya sp. NPDC008237 TaxID=3363978 RepID=UPI0036EB192A
MPATTPIAGGTPPAPGLKENAIGLSGALMRSVTTMSPAITVALTVHPSFERPG